MTALAANYVRPFKEGRNVSYDVGAAVTIYEGAAVMSLRGTGYAIPGADTALGIFHGVADEAADNSSGANAAIEVKVRRGTVEFFACSGASVTWIGKKVYLTDDNTVALTSTNFVLVGEVVAVPSSTLVEVQTPKFRITDRAELVEETLKEFDYPLTDVRAADYAALAIAETAGDHFLNLGTNLITIDGEASISETEVSVSYLRVTLPPEYVSGGGVGVLIRHAVTGSGTLGTCTVDLNVYQQEDITAGSDICATTATAMTATWTETTFTITSTDLEAGDVLNVKLTTSIAESAGTAIAASIEKIALVCDVKG